MSSMKGKKIGLATLISHHDHGAVHGVALPEIVGRLGLKFATINGSGCGRPEYPFAFEEPVEGAFAQEQAGGKKLSLFQFGAQGGKGASGHLGSELNDHGGRFFVDDPAHVPGHFGHWGKGTRSFRRFPDRP